MFDAAMPAPKREEVATFRELLIAARGQLGLNNQELAARLLLSPRTVGRWTCGHTTPPHRTAIALLLTLRDIDRGILAQMAEALGVDLEVVLGAPAAKPGTVNEDARRVVDAALFAAAEAADIGAKTLRAAVVRVLDAAVACSLDARQARAALAPSRRG